MANYLYRSEKWLRHEYCVEKKRVVEIAKLCGVHKPTIYMWIRKFGLTRSSIFPVRSLKRYLLNERYFEKIDTGDKAYWLGFIAADGCVVNKKGRRHFFIELGRKDRGHLEKFREEIEYEGPIYDMERSSNGVLSSKIQIASCRMVQDLIGHGIVPRKSHILQRPNINKKYYSHWIRGLFDGDGSVSLRKKDGHVGGEFFGTKNVVEFIVENIYGTNTVSHKKGCDGWYHSFGGNGTSIKIFNYLYEDSNIYLERKKKIFLKVKTLDV